MKRLLPSLLIISLVLSGCSTTDNQTVESSVQDGIYSAVKTGMKGDVEVEVTVKNQQIEDVTVKNHSETYGIGYGLNETPVESIPTQIKETQSLNIDIVTGATITTNAILGAAEEALAQAGFDTEALKTKEVAPVTEDVHEESDVVIIGAGAAGISAGISALESGATNVIIVEKQGITGGATTRSGGKLIAAPTQWQEKQGFTDSSDALLEYFYTMDGSDQLNDTLMENFVSNSAENMTWMENYGVMIYDVEPIHSSITPYRVHNTTNEEDHHGGGMTDGFGGNIMVPLTEQFMEMGGKIIYNTTCNEIVTDENGSITGVKGVKEDGSNVEISSDKVIIATGGYASNREMTARYGFDSYATQVPVGNVGEGLVMAEKLNAQVYNAPSPQVVFVDYLGGVGINEEAGLIVNDQGQRVCNEYSYQYHVGNALYQSGSKLGYYITTGNEAYPTVQYAISNEKVIKANSIEELAELINIDAQTLKTTVDRYNELCDKGVDEDFNKPADFMNKIEGETYYALTLNPAITVTFGGLVIDENAQVLDVNNEVINGLYAAGEVAFTGLFGNEYPGCGMAISSAVYFGRIAGSNAVTTE